MRIKVLNVDGTPDNVGDVFDKDTEILFAEQVPVDYEFFPEIDGRAQRVIAFAKLERAEDGIYATFKPLEGALVKGLTPAIGGVLIERDDAHVKKVEITCIALTPTKNSDARITPIDVEE